MKPKTENNNPPPNETIFSNNVNILKRKFPTLWKKFQDSLDSNQSSEENAEKDKPITDHIRNYKALFYRNEDPKSSVKKIIDDWQFDPYDILFLVGMGLGYLPVEAIRKGVGDPRIIIIEPSAQIFEQALYENDLRPILLSERVDLVVGKNIHIAQLVERYQDIIPIGRNRVVVHPNYDLIVGETILAIKQELTERIRALRDTWHTTEKYGRQMFDNTIANLPSMFAGTPMRKLRNNFKSIPAICIAAGPSLDHVLPELKKLQNRALIIACDSAVNPLMKASIQPHFVVTTDIFKTNIDKLKPHFEALSETVLIYGFESNPDNVRLYLGQNRVAVSAYSKLLLYWLDPSLNLQSQLPSMASVSHMAIFSSLALGAAPIIMVGMDLAYFHGKSHSYNSDFFHSLDHEKIVKTVGNSGAMIPSSPQFVADKLLIEKIIGQGKARFINTSVKGVHISGAQIKRLDEVVDEFKSTAQLDPGNVLENVDWEPAANEKTAVATVTRLIQEFRTFKQTCSDNKSEILDKIDQIENFSNGALPLEMVQEAVKRFDEFQDDLSFYVQVVKDIMLPELHEIFTKKEILSVQIHKNKKNMILENLRLLAEHYEVYEKGMELIISRLKGFNKFFEDLIAITDSFEGSDQDWEKHIQRARYFENSGELWQAKREYECYMTKQPKDISPYLELTQAYLKVNLWEAAKKIVKKAHSLFGDAVEVAELESEIKRGTDAILDEIKKEWMQGNIHTTRKLMNQYLILRPLDPQINELKRVIQELDEVFSSEWDEEETKKAVRLDMQTRIKMAAERIQNIKFEEGIGILEGIIEDFPRSSGQLREQIGDIRLSQKDYKSASWNFSQALKYMPDNSGIQKKILAVRKLMNS